MKWTKLVKSSFNKIASTIDLSDNDIQDIIYNDVDNLNLLANKNSGIAKVLGKDPEIDTYEFSGTINFTPDFKAGQYEGIGGYRSVNAEPTTITETIYIKYYDNGKFVTKPFTVEFDINSVKAKNIKSNNDLPKSIRITEDTIYLDF